MQVLNPVPSVMGILYHHMNIVVAALTLHQRRGRLHDCLRRLERTYANEMKPLKSLQPDSRAARWSHIPVELAETKTPLLCSDHSYV